MGFGWLFSRRSTAITRNPARRPPSPAPLPRCRVDRNLPFTSSACPLPRAEKEVREWLESGGTKETLTAVKNAVQVASKDKSHRVVSRVLISAPRPASAWSLNSSHSIDEEESGGPKLLPEYGESLTLRSYLRSPASYPPSEGSSRFASLSDLDMDDPSELSPLPESIYSSEASESFETAEAVTLKYIRPVSVYGSGLPGRSGAMSRPLASPYSDSDASVTISERPFNAKNAVTSFVGEQFHFHAFEWAPGDEDENDPGYEADCYSTDEDADGDPRQNCFNRFNREEAPKIRQVPCSTATLVEPPSAPAPDTPFIIQEPQFGDIGKVDVAEGDLNDCKALVRCKSRLGVHVCENEDHLFGAVNHRDERGQDLTAAINKAYSLAPDVHFERTRQAVRNNLSLIRHLFVRTIPRPPIIGRDHVQEIQAQHGPEVWPKAVEALVNICWDDERLAREISILMGEAQELPQGYQKKMALSELWPGSTIFKRVPSPFNRSTLVDEVDEHEDDYDQEATENKMDPKVSPALVDVNNHRLTRPSKISAEEDPNKEAERAFKGKVSTDLRAKGTRSGLKEVVNANVL
jgi:hypothetical protein